MENFLKLCCAFYAHLQLIGNIFIKFGAGKNGTFNSEK
jgi:hypothetical protein